MRHRGGCGDSRFSVGSVWHHRVSGVTMLVTGLPNFALTDFKHPELVDPVAAALLQRIRTTFGIPMVLTDDARLPGDVPEGGSLTSLHYQGRAFDIRCRDWVPSQMWHFVTAVQSVAESLALPQAGVELELVWSDTDKHCHVGFHLDGRADTLIVRAT